MKHFFLKPETNFDPLRTVELFNISTSSTVRVRLHIDLPLNVVCVFSFSNSSLFIKNLLLTDQCICSPSLLFVKQLLSRLVLLSLSTVAFDGFVTGIQ